MNQIQYHAISQSRLLNLAINSSSVTGQSRFHLDQKGENLGIWTSSELPLLIDGGYGNERANEVIGEYELDGEKHQIRKPLFAIVLQIIDAPNRTLVNPLVPDQTFLVGDVPWNNVVNLLIREGNVDSRETAERVIFTLRERFGLNIGIETFDPNIGLEWKYRHQEEGLKKLYLLSDRVPKKSSNPYEIKLDKEGKY
ncbi:MAG: hypothetical protein A3A51_00540 [Candidatus Levybacteria bacterium RIFCSPLOWO2_01_FULL_39_10]|nr:MAG: hypothetical protein A3A51_00540 [Candidatus Levybacteria bacterium RIFCSPLOWO2_01_FULL_39_10]